MSIATDLQVRLSMYVSVRLSTSQRSYLASKLQTSEYPLCVGAALSLSMYPKEHDSIGKQSGSLQRFCCRSHIQLLPCKETHCDLLFFKFRYLWAMYGEPAFMIAAVQQQLHWRRHWMCSWLGMTCLRRSRTRRSMSLLPSA